MEPKRNLLSTYCSFLRAVLEKNHEMDPFIDIILAILFVTAPRNDSLLTTLKCLACIFLFHPSSNVSSAEKVKILRVIAFSQDIPRTHERNSTREWDWLMVFTSIRSTASGSVARALELITSAVLLPEQPVSDIRVHVIANGFFASFLAVGKKRYQMNEEKLQAATLFCLSYFSPRSVIVFSTFSFN